MANPLETEIGKWKLENCKSKEKRRSAVGAKDESANRRRRTFDALWLKNSAETRNMQLDAAGGC
jgi:hypothetical protein